jgi:hypothetical protein
MNEIPHSFSKMPTNERFFVESAALRWYASSRSSEIVILWVRADGEDFLLVAIWNRPMTFTAFVVALTISARITHAEPPPWATFTCVADTGTLIPSGEWAGQPFGDFAHNQRPALDRGIVAFVGRPAISKPLNAMFAWSDDSLRVIADPATPRPDGEISFSSFRDPEVRDGRFVFAADLRIYREVGGILTLVGNVGRSTSPSVDGDANWFLGDQTYVVPGPGGPTIRVNGVYRAEGSSISTIAITGQPIAGTTEKFNALDRRVVARKGEAVFWGDGSLYRFAAGAAHRFVDATSFTDLFVFDFDGDTTAFFARTEETGLGVFRRKDGVVTLEAQHLAPAPGGGHFFLDPRNHNDVSVHDGHIVFSSGGGAVTLPDAIYSDLGGSLQRIVGAGDGVLGQIVRNVSIGPDALSGHQIAFWASFTNGNSGIFVASLPEPTELTLLLIFLCVVSSRGRRR